MPTTDRQRAANRANAQRSTGPKTPAGKSRSAQNAVRHGFASTAFTIARVEDPQEIARLRADLIHVHQPVNAQELFALERAALAQQSILRAARLEAGLFTAFANDMTTNEGDALFHLNEVLRGELPQNTNYALADGYRRATHGHGALTWSLFLRYQAQAERQYRRAIDEFERLKKLRPELPNEDIPNEPIPDPQPEAPAPLEDNETNPNPPVSAPLPPPSQAGQQKAASTIQSKIPRSGPNATPPLA